MHNIIKNGKFNLIKSLSTLGLNPYCDINQFMIQKTTVSSIYFIIIIIFTRSCNGII